MRTDRTDVGWSAKAMGDARRAGDELQTAI
jgi:hypothetical protein